MPFSNPLFYPQITYISKYLQNYLVKNFNSIRTIKLYNCTGINVTISPDIIPNYLKPDYRLIYKGLIVYLAKKDLLCLRILSHSYQNFNNSKLEIEFPDQSLKIEVKVIIKDIEWDEVHLICEDFNDLDSCTKAFGRKKHFFNDTDINLIITPDFLKSVRNIGKFGVRFDEVIEALSKVRFRVVDKGLHLEKMRTSDEWRVYVNKNRGDRIHFKYCENGILLLRYYNPSEHDEYK